MIPVLSVLAGLVWGGLFGMVNILITKKIAAGSAGKLNAMSLLRTLVDLAALAVVYFVRDLLPLRFEIVLIATAVTLSLVGIVSAFRIASSMK